jgi:hypothetical protein
MMASLPAAKESLKTYDSSGFTMPPTTVSHRPLSVSRENMTPAEPISLRTIFWRVAHSWTFEC